MARRTVFVSGYLDWDDGAIRAIIHGRDGETAREVRRLGRIVQLRAQRAAPVRTGQLRSSIKVIMEYPPSGPSAVVEAQAPYSLPVHSGRREVYPVTAKRLHWRTDDGRDVFALRAGPVEGRPFLARALDAIG